MTLKEWCEKADVKPTHPTTERGAVSLTVPRPEATLSGELWWRLWTLDDYAVSTVSGPVVWLVPRKVPTEV